MSKPKKKCQTAPKAQLNNPEWEKTAVRMLGGLPIQPETRNLGWLRLERWPEANTVVLAIRAVFTNLYRRDDPYTQQAVQWLTVHAHEPLVQAVACHEASFSREARQVVLNDFFDYFFSASGFPAASNSIWAQVQEGTVTWPALEDAFGLWQEKFRLTPHPRQLDKWETCRWVMIDPPFLPNLPPLIGNFLEEPGLERAVNLQKAILAWLTPEIEPKPPIKRIIEKLISVAITELWNGTLAIMATSSWNGSMTRLGEEIADLIRAKIPELTQEQLADLLKLGYPVTEDMEEELLTLVPREIAAEYLRDEYAKVTGPGPRRDYQSFARVTRLTTLPAEITAPIVAHAGQMYDLQTVFEGHPNLYREHYGPIVRSGRPDLLKVMHYASVVGEEARADVAEWLPRQEDMGPLTNDRLNGLKNMDPDILFPFIQRLMLWDLPAGALMTPKHINVFLDCGYRLRPEDLAGSRRLRGLVGKQYLNSFERFIGEEKRVWQNEQWRETILDFKRTDRLTDPEYVFSLLGSLLSNAAFGNISEEELRAWFKPLFKLSEDTGLLGFMLIEAMGSKRGLFAERLGNSRWDGSYVAMRLVSRQSREWLQDIDGLPILKKFLVEDDKLLFRAASYHPDWLPDIFTREELIEILFGHLELCGTTFFNSPDTTKWVDALNIYHRLQRWLLAHLPQAKDQYRDLHKWLDTIRNLNMDRDPAVLHALRPLLEVYDPHWVARAVISFFTPTES